MERQVPDQIKHKDTIWRLCVQAGSRQHPQSQESAQNGPKPQKAATNATSQEFMAPIETITFVDKGCRCTSKNI